MEIFTSLLAAGLFFWAIVLFVFLALIFLSEEETWGWTIFCVIAGALGIQFLTDISIFGYIWNNPKDIAVGLLGYAVIGVVWSYFKWVFVVTNRLNRFNSVQEDFFEQNNIKDGVVPTSKSNKYLRYINDNYRPSGKLPDYSEYSENREYDSEEIREWITPHPKYYKAKITYWIAWWPTSLIWTIFDDSLRKIAKTIYYGIANSLKRIAQRRFNKVNIVLNNKDQSSE